MRIVVRDGRARIDHPADRAVTAALSDDFELLGPTWSGALAYEGQLTGDGRMIEAGALRWEELPAPLLWIPEQGEGGHQGAVIIGRILTVERDGDEIYGRGDLDWSIEEAREVAGRLDREVDNGISVDLDDVDYEIRVAQELLEEPMPVEAEVPAEEETDEDGRVTVIEVQSDDEVMVTTDARLRGATVAAIPAFVGARIELDEPLDDQALVASVLGASDLPVAALDRDWDGDAAQDRVFDDCTDGDDVDVSCLSRAFLWRDDDADPETQAAYSLGYADVVDGDLQIVPNAVYAIASVLSGGRGGVDVPDADMSDLQAATCRLYDRISAEHGADNVPDCPFDDDTEEGVLASAAALEVPFFLAAAGVDLDLPPRGWFDDPDLDGVTPLTVDDDGRVFGHIAPWGSCHTGYADVCMEPPPSTSGYAYFHTGEAVTDDGRVPVGHITVDTDHAGRRMAASDAVAHYEHSGHAAARVRAGEDEHGIWVAGTVVPSASDEQVRMLREHSPSGDWRHIGGSLELVHVLAVNSPGFPVPRARVASGRVVTLQTGFHGHSHEVSDAAGLTDDEVAEMRQAVRHTRRIRADRAAERVGV